MERVSAAAGQPLCGARARRLAPRPRHAGNPQPLPQPKCVPASVGPISPGNTCLLATSPYLASMWSAVGFMARDRRLAAVHEAGHLVVARLFGVDISSCRIFPNRGWSAAEPTYEKSWIGRIQFCSVKSSTVEQRRLIGIAGVVAECCWNNEDETRGAEELLWEPRRNVGERLGVDWA